MKFSIHKLDGTHVEFHAYWYHEQFERVLYDVELFATNRLVKRALGATVCTLTPTMDGKVQTGSTPIAQGDAACSASEPGGYNKQRGRIASFGSALREAEFNRVERAALWKQYWGQQRGGVACGQS